MNKSTLYMESNKHVIKALRISDININEIMIGKKKNKTVPISYNGKSLIFQTPYLEVAGELRKTAYQNIYQLDTLLSGDTKRRIDRLTQFIENLEIHIINHINSNPNWFTQNNIQFKALIKEPNQERETYFIKWAIDLKTNIFVDESKNKFNPSNIKSKDLVKLIVEISDLWINENQCGLVVIVRKAMVKSHIEKIPNEYDFDVSESEEAPDENESNIDENESNIISLLATEQKKKNPKITEQKDDIEISYPKNKELQLRKIVFKNKDINMPLFDDFFQSKNIVPNVTINNHNVASDELEGTNEIESDTD